MVLQSLITPSTFSSWTQAQWLLPYGLCVWSWHHWPLLPSLACLGGPWMYHSAETTTLPGLLITSSTSMEVPRSSFISTSTLVLFSLLPFFLSLTYIYITLSVYSWILLFSYHPYIPFWTGTGFQSKGSYLFGHFGMYIKMVPGDSAGTVTAFYVMLLSVWVLCSLFSFGHSGFCWIHKMGCLVRCFILCLCDWIWNCELCSYLPKTRSTMK